MTYLTFMIPEPPQGSSFTHHPISRGSRPKTYKPNELLDSGEGRGEWLDFFERCLMGIYWKQGNLPVPYSFETADKSVRSLDAGCLKFLQNQHPSQVRFNLDRFGHISSVVPSDEMIARWHPLKSSILADFAAAKWRQST